MTFSFFEVVAIHILPYNVVGYSGLVSDNALLPVRLVLFQNLSIHFQKRTMKLTSLSLLAAAFATVAASPVSLNELTGANKTIEQPKATLDDADVNRKCHTVNSDYLPSLAPGAYGSSAYHNCFRTDAQVDEYLDVLVKQNAGALHCKPFVSYQGVGLPIWAYKISTGARPSSLYLHALLHAREWVATSSAVHTISTILDNIAKPTPTDTHDLIIVPLVNVDGYRMTWSGARYQRKSANEVDLNRNWYTPIANPKPPSPSSLIYPGPTYFSEKETMGLRDYLLKNRASIDGYIDLHAFAAEVMAPFGDTKEPVGGGLDEKYKTMNTKIAKAMSNKYKPTLSHQMYLVYGSFMNYAVREFAGKPSITIEMDGTDFVEPASSIITRGIRATNDDLSMHWKNNTI
uniref:Peptidase M14 domain-containing protein n=1 Tax=Hucho hucho TaxID=62062 RepID=A0A4W5Q2B7_9TELE